MSIFSRVLVAALGLCTAPSVFAYLDPGTGSMLIQGLIAAIAMISITAKTYWYRLKDMFATGSGESVDEEPLD